MNHLLDVDPAAAAPIWRQIEDGMRRIIASGRLSPGAAVPSVRELARTLRVNPATVSKAYRRLTDAGLLLVRRGEGTFVAERSDEEWDDERRRLLTHGAEEFIRVAKSVGATRKQVEATVSECWQSMDAEGEEEVSDER
jgi:GntR family transcriptional regulator